ncbi:hypothetical protein [Pseudanabaena sp. PCC 6802]|uniref:hypothetical protein n=1 Tax=Pseudanabaena sp. PCC 6802 TaxID=118173 RepID=UPI0003490D51|nr:hypothetical protein [Pseudanabaena sp. PCC 6802]
MKAYDFFAKVTPEGKLELPSTLLTDLDSNQKVRVVVLVDESTNESKSNNEESEGQRLAIEHFFTEYSEADAIYDKI